MAVIFVEGFEKHCPTIYNDANGGTWNVGQAFVSTDSAAASLLRDWSSLLIGGGGGGAFVSYVPGRPGGGGVALKHSAASFSATTLRRNLPASYSRAIVGFALYWTGGHSAGCGFIDAGTSQVSVNVDTVGRITFARNVTTLFTSAPLFLPNSWHFIEMDCTIHPTAGHYQIWVDGVSLVNSDNLQNTRNTANSSFNQLDIGISTGSGYSAFDDIYLFDTTGSTNNAQRGDGVIQTLRPTSDDSIQFAKTAYSFGWYACQVATTVSTSTPGANQLILVPVTPEVNCTIQSVGIRPLTTAAGAKMKGVLYTDSGGNPGTLISDGTEVVGTVNGTSVTLPFVTPTALTGGTQYWVGYYSDTALTHGIASNTLGKGQRKANTYASGAPAGPLTGMTTGQVVWQIWATATGAASSYALVDEMGGSLVNSIAVDYVSSANVGDEDLYVMSDLIGTTSNIACVQVSALMGKSGTTSRDGQVRLKSNTTDSGGSSTTLSTTPTQVTAIYETDPDTGVAWGASGVNAIKAGFKVSA